MTKFSTVSLRYIRAALCSFILIATSALANGDAAQLDQVFPKASLQIATPDARVHRFRVWIAETDPQRMRGLMFVKHLDDDQGMLFMYPQTQMISMWMKNTYIPLDMVFIGADGRVSHIAANTTPHSLETVSSGKPASAVLELKGGMAQKLRIAPGAVVTLGQ